MASRGSKGPAAPWWARCSPPSAPGGSASTRRGFSWLGRGSASCSPRAWARGWNIAAGGTAIHHVWFHGDTQVGDVELQVGGSPWRTWSRKSVPADWTGPWHVEVRDAAGAVLKRIDFTVGQ